MNSEGSYQPPPPASAYSSPSSRQEEGWWDWAYKGVDHTLPGNGGPECRDFLSLSQRCWESAMASGIGLLALLYAYPRLRLPVACPSRYKDGDPRGKRILLILMCLTFGIELGFKFSTRQVIWIGNPCHLATMMQIFILAAPPSRIVTAAFRLHMHMLTGAPIAILFPVINTRLLPFETGVYFLQHILMLIIPFYLMKTGDPFIPEELLDFKWAFTSFGFLYIYHFLPLQFLAYHSQVNLNNMLCPAVSDPFHGKYYRLFAICHQIILIPTLGKIFVIIAKAFRILPCNDLPNAPISQVFSSNNVVDCPKEPPCCTQPSVCCCPSACRTDSCCPMREASLLQSTKKSTSCGDNGSVCDCCYQEEDSGISASGVTGCNKTRIGSFAPSNTTSHCASASVCSGKEDSCPNGFDDQRNSSTKQSRMSMADGNCCPTPAPTTSVCSTGAVKSCGEGDTPTAPAFVTRRLVNGKVSGGCQQQQQAGQQKGSHCACGGGGCSRTRHRSGSASDRRGDRPMSVSELDGRNGHAKAH